jgi:sulfate transport system substrate-binding protein
VTPNPFTSGGARWNVMAAYGAWRKAGKTDKQAQANLLKLFKNVVVQDKSARDSLNTFVSGKGDVLLGYENEAIFASLKGQNVPYVIPRSTILIENPVAVLKNSDSKDKANQFLRFLRTPAAQQIFADNGYRPVVKSVLEKNRKKFPARPGEFTIDQLGLGGWEKVQKRFFDPKSGIMARIERQVGGVTG